MVGPMLPVPVSPQPPSGAVAMAEGGVVKVSWAPPTVTTGITGYRVQIGDDKVYRITNGASANSVTFDDLRPGVQYHFTIVALGAGSPSTGCTSNPVVAPAHVTSAWWAKASWLMVGLVIAFLGVSLGMWLGGVSHPQTWYSLAIASGTVAAGLALITAINGGSHGYGLFRTVVGADGRVSTSKTQAALWTLLIAFVVAYFASLTMLADRHHLFEGFSIDAAPDNVSVWGPYLILLGGPFASLVLAKGIVSAKVSSGTLQKAVNADGSASITQALTDDSGNVDLVDSQYLLFNLIAMVYVVMGLAKHGQLPELPPLLLGLTGTAAATYVISKSVEANTPQLNSVVPTRVQPGDRLRLDGANFMPSGASSTAPIVLIDGLQATLLEAASNTTVVVEVPPGLVVGVKSATVTTAARVTSNSLPIEVATRPMQIVGLTPSPQVARGSKLTVEGVGFIFPGSAANGTVSVSFDGSVQALPVTRVGAFEQFTIDVTSTSAGTKTFTIRPAALTEILSASIDVS
jgi:hypothetical protein